MGWHRIRDAEGNLHSLDDEQYALYLENQRKQKRMGCILKIVVAIIAFILFLILVGASGDDKKDSPSKPNEETINKEAESKSEEDGTKINALMNAQPEKDVQDHVAKPEEDITEKQDDNTVSQESSQDNTSENLASYSDDPPLAETEQIVDSKSQKELEKEAKRRAKEEAKAAKRKAKEEAKEAKRRAKEEAKRAAE